MANALEEPPSAPAPKTLRTDTLAESVVILLALTVIQRMVGFVRALLFCRWMDEEALGQWDMAFSFLLLAAPLAVLSLPSCFRRYVEYYRERFQLQMLLRRTAVFYIVCSVTAATIIYVGRDWFSHLVFGSAGHGRMVAILAVSLLAVLAYHFFIDLLTSLRNIRLISILQLVQSVTFAVLGAGFLICFGCTAIAVVGAYAIASALIAVIAIGWLVRSWSAFPQAGPLPPQRQFWAKLLPFSAGVWVTSLMGNLFGVADRYMIIHFAALPSEEALGLVGQYHTSRVVPLLLVSVAAMLGSIITPHLSQDWEQGQRERVCLRLNLYLKLTCFGLMAGAIAVLLIAPLLFGVAFQGKFSGGQAVLPWTLIYCVWFGLNTVAQNYLWCAEKTRLASLAWLVGLLVNVGLNLVLLPRLGLLGAVLATTVANLVAILLIAAFNSRLGFRMNLGTWVTMALPPSICLGPWVALVVLVALVVNMIYHDRLFPADEKQHLANAVERYWDRIHDLFPKLRSTN